ncbi:uncharacterized protein LOC119113607 [Pollicipes pollicipes]|uniref:uncharacterized protein LOC119113607 n=1 Tax=Pollicipes pollicipes TaxID=41117 RepID=UPI001884C2C8|nr:uncharacterized protein LOC119113607 [Pollicipes pollicipes]
MTSATSAPPPDYENVIAVNVHRADLGVRAWRAYSDVGDSAHNYSVVTERAGRLDDSATEPADQEGPAGGRHTYENTDNVALMIAHLEDAPPAPPVPEASPQAAGPTRDSSLLVATIDGRRALGVSAQSSYVNLRECAAV